LGAFLFLFWREWPYNLTQPAAMRAYLGPLV
jgi:hypothetical protein